MNDGSQPHFVVTTLDVEALLARLANQELTKPVSQRREVPTMPDLAGATGMQAHFTQNDGHQQLTKTDLTTASLIFHDLRQRGFDIQVYDLFRTL